MLPASQKAFQNTVVWTQVFCENIKKSRGCRQGKGGFVDGCETLAVMSYGFDYRTKLAFS